MSVKFATAVFLAAAITSSPAFACKGPTVIYQDNFQSADPAWSAPFGGTPVISGGQAQVTAQPGDFNVYVYEGTFVDSGDYCVTVTGPTLSDPTSALGGVAFGFDNNGDFYAFLVREDGQATVYRNQNGGWLTPVAMRAAPALKTGTASNTLRVTWKGTTASAFINDQPFINFTIQAFKNSMIALYAEADGNAPATYSFSNLNVTTVP